MELASDGDDDQRIRRTYQPKISTEETCAKAQDPDYYGYTLTPYDLERYKYKRRERERDDSETPIKFLSFKIVMSSRSENDKKVYFITGANRGLGEFPFCPLLLLSPCL
jgi:hypothetical protein